MCELMDKLEFVTLEKMVYDFYIKHFASISGYYRVVEKLQYKDNVLEITTHNVGQITGKTGARIKALQSILKIRFPNIKIIIIKYTKPQIYK